MAYQTLSSEKYLQESLEQERQINYKKIRRQQMSNLTTNLFALFSVAIVVFVAIKTMPVWTPAVFRTLHSWGMM